MKTAKELAATVNKAISHGSVPEYRKILKTKCDIKIVSRVFAHFTVKYGHKWSSLFPEGDLALYEESKSMWAEEMGGLTMEQIKYALDIVVDNYPEWPPTVGQFKQLCKLSEIEPDYVPLKLDNPAKPETVAANLAAMMRSLK